MTLNNSNGASPDAQEAENVGHFDKAEGSFSDETTRSQGFKPNTATSAIAREPHHGKLLQPAYSHLPLHLYETCIYIRIPRRQDGGHATVSDTPAVHMAVICLP